MYMYIYNSTHFLPSVQLHTRTKLQERHISEYISSMAEEFQAEVCGGSLWSSPRAIFNTNSSFLSTYGGCWQNDLINMKTRSTDESSGCCATAILPDTACQMMGSSPSTTTNWYQALLVDGRTGESYRQTLPEILNNLPSNFGMDQDQASNFITNSGDCTGNFGSMNDYPSSLLQTLFDGESSPPAAATVYDVQTNLNNFDPVSSVTFFSNTSALDINDNQAGFFASNQAYEEKPKCSNIKTRNEDFLDDMGSSVKKSSSESTTYKRPRLETPSPLPTFKVRKEKLGDRVTALQQLVSPFGKTDTASVLHEAIEYIKLLHDQVNVLSNPYMKNGATMQVQQISDKAEDNNEGAKQDLRSRGLCLVPVSSTFPVTAETTPDYWTSCFRGTF
ncbi:putative transcription factor bHLH family [Helianthus annuus]|uniref:Putative myc-type, basic helix-loop-helix (BHLH) domain-containing protein n=1 Tax=Helianthus annuus TaxID=4232 RepID=A0A251UKQ3_HELAN|nr:transcription factor bHLH112 [Helianthus annuus]KAF5804220.1 putative transcription factor bHLH family [Helianthus annuus]KAJ0568882.1 putative transcription factor bHLH family [Helianthus annuus]KAJ0583165.1 putative transcription factor bHLH family [Helianthus annuus]KAJ0748890.1 putative transcription factor bHLH family [Helianthus annuus]